MKKLVILFMLGLCFVACNKERENSYEIVPYPNSLDARAGQFQLTNQCKLLFSTAMDSAMRKVATQFLEQLHATSGLLLSSEDTADEVLSKNSIAFFVAPDLASEAYRIHIESDQAKIEASTAAGFFYAVQSLKQLLPVAIYGQEPCPNENWNLPCVLIEDAPRFSYRGMHLDVARHFFSLKEVKRYIDILSVYKLNTFHWHLTDDQGWRIEIKKYPRLTEVGSIRKGTVVLKEQGKYDGVSYGGYYTQDEIREIVAYAADRFITVIPEIDLPGHMLSALASYPELGCTGGPYEVSGQWGVLDDVLCAGKEKTFTFIEEVLTEVMDLFPSTYIHVGGDECPKVRWEKCPHCQARINSLGLKTDSLHRAEHYLQSYTISRVEKFLNERGRQIIGWDEILEGGLAPNATVMSWRGMDGGIEGARQNHKVIMTPNTYLYFDYYQTLDTIGEPFSIGGCVPVELVYSLDPVPAALQGSERDNIIGVQANLWSEYILIDQQLEYQLLPRLAALSEVQWTQPEQKNWERFLNAAGHQVKIYDVMGYQYGKHLFAVLGSYRVNSEKNCVEALLTTQGEASIYYTLDGTEPTTQSQLYTAPVELTKSCTLRAMVKRDNMNTRILSKKFQFNKATGKAAVMNTKPREKYKYGGASLLTDGIRGEYGYSNGCWIGYFDEPFDVTIDFPQATSVSSVTLGTMIQFGEDLFPPSKLTVFVAAEGADWVSMGELIVPESISTDKDELREFTYSFAPTSAKRIRVVAETTPRIPDWHGARGRQAFLFVDELIVN